MTEGAEENHRLVEKGDLDEILRVIDRLCDNGEWAVLDDLRGKCRRAYERGHQLWPAASNAEYRIALDGPVELAARITQDGESLFSIGPLTEVVAQNHSWSELDTHLKEEPVRTLVAHERILRGDVVAAEAIDQRVLGIPVAAAPWESGIALANYKPYTGEFLRPAIPSLAVTPLKRPQKLDAGHAAVNDEAVDALRALVAPWVEQSAGRLDAVSVEGTAEQAIATLGVPMARWAEGTVESCAAAMHWAAASGGAHGRRRGGASARFNTWWAIAALCNVLEDWPLATGELEPLARELRWYHWHDSEPAQGWELNIAVEDPGDGLAWAITAQDLKL